MGARRGTGHGMSDEGWLMDTCLDLVRKEIKDLSEKELDEVLEQMRARQAVIIRDGGDPSTAAAQAGMDVAANLRAAAAIEKRNAAINFKVRTEALDYIRTTWKDDPTEGVLSLLYGSIKNRFGARASAAAAQSALIRRYLAGAAGELEQAGLFAVLRRGEMDQDVTRALWDIDTPDKLKDLPPQAVEIAKIMRKWQEVARVDANRHGAWIGKDPNYVVRQSHSPDRLNNAGEAKWKADILPRLDLARMFPDGPPKDLDSWLSEAYANLTTGIRPDRADAGAARMSAFKGPGNLGKKLSQERVFQFKSADDWFEYNQEYGFGNLREAYVQGLHRSAESTGLMQVLGTNPEYNLDAIVKSMRNEMSRENPELLKKFDAQTRGGKRISNAYAEVSGATRHAASVRLAAVGAGIRAFNTLTGLGGAVISSVTDVPVRASALRFQGQSYLRSLSEGVIAPIKRIVSGVGSAERKASLSAIGYFNEVAIGNLAARFSPDESMPGRFQKATNTFFKWNLLGPWQDEMQRSALESMGRFFGDLSGQDFGKLSDRTRTTLERYRIDDTAWKAIRKGIAEEDGGAKFLTPTAVRELDLDTFLPLAVDRLRALKESTIKRGGDVTKLDRQVNKILEETRESAADKLQQLYADELKAAVIQPDARTLAFIRQGQQAGTPVGEALRLFFQFKSFGIAIMQRGFLREFYGYDKGAGGKLGTSELHGLAMFMAGSMSFGYLAMSMKDLIKGKEPRPIDNYKTWQAAAAQGGGFGIYGDFLFGEASRFGQGFLQTLGGPTVGKADQIFSLWNKVKAGDDVGAEALRFTISNTPYANLFYTRMAIDYLFLYELQESMSPGYLRRMEKRVEKENGQQWWLPPTSAAN